MVERTGIESVKSVSRLAAFAVTDTRDYVSKNDKKLGRHARWTDTDKTPFRMLCSQQKEKWTRNGESRKYSIMLTRYR
jgi:hypothetical protein